MIIKCPECNLHISSTAKECKKCGATGARFEEKIENIIKLERDAAFGKKVEEKVQCKICTKNVMKKDLKIIKWGTQLVCDSCYFEYKDKNRLGILILLRNPSVETWRKMTIKNKIIFFFQIIVICYVIAFCLS